MPMNEPHPPRRPPDPVPRRSRSRVTHVTTFLGLLSVSCLVLLHSQTLTLGLEGRDGRGIPAVGTAEGWGPAASSLATNFTFPSRRERIVYYMGDWHGRTLRPGDVPCHELAGLNRVISDRLVLWEAGKMGRHIRRDGGTNWLVGAYLKDALDVLDGKEQDKGDDGWLVLNIGDSHSRSTVVPAVAKTRFSRFAKSRGAGGGRFFAPIVWPLEMSRHYDPVNEYIHLEEEGRVARWEEKRPTLIWRGGVTGVAVSDKRLLTTHTDGGPRLRVVREYFDRNVTDVDVAFQAGSPTVGWAGRYRREVSRLVRDTDTSMADQMKYKYILMLEGNDVATGLKWQLASNSVVFMARPTTVSFLMEDMLVPFVHYVPLKDDHSNLVDMVNWARQNDKKCRWISEQATLFMERLFLSKEAKAEHTAVKRELGEAYRRQFGEAVGWCAEKV